MIFVLVAVGINIKTVNKYLTMLPYNRIREQYEKPLVPKIKANYNPDNPVQNLGQLQILADDL